MTEEKEAGGFFDEDGKVSQPETRLEEDFRIAREKKQHLITQAVTDGNITQEYAHLLHSIRSVTTSGDLTTLEKVEAALDLNDRVEPTFRDGTVAYIGSGTDWEFAVALGAKNIDMVDMMFSDDEGSQRLLEKCKEFDPDARFDPETQTVHFGVNLGKGSEPITLKLHGGDASRYEPDTQLKGVIEIAGPTKGYGADGPVLPHVKKKMAPGGKVVNFDYMQLHADSPVPTGFQSQAVGKFTVLSAA
jgi:hypothetical protein